MYRLEIEVPEFNDSFVRATLDNKQYLLRFTYNDTCDFWSFGVFDMQKKPIQQGIKIVPSFPLNLYCSAEGMPSGIFGAFTDLDRIGKDDFRNGKAIFAYAPMVE